jgi:hypothetical protein
MMTGIGAVAYMEVSDSGGNDWDGTIVTEKVNQTKNTCGARARKVCSNESGESGGFKVGAETNLLGKVKMDALRNTFYDLHVFTRELSILHELWVRGESAGYATHITSDPLPGTNAKNILMASAFVDQQVSNQATEIAARTLGLPSLIGSLQTNLAEIPDRDGPLPSALVMYDTGSFDLTNSADAPFIAPLANVQPESNRCDPHGLQSRIPAALDQLRTFLQPGGQVVNYCNGRCDAGEPLELPGGKDVPCDPLAP